MEILSLHKWDETLWPSIECIYNEAFPDQEKKSKSVFQEAVSQQVGVMHTAFVDGEMSAMAFTGVSQEAEALLIDYIAVRAKSRSKGIGSALLEHLMNSATSLGLRGVIIEVEYQGDGDASADSQNRIQFWRKHGFCLTQYVHQYRWVSEWYQAMYKNLDNRNPLPSDGVQLFQCISAFHKLTYQRRFVSKY